MSEERLRLALVGCGSASLVQYVPAMRYSQRGVVAALCDPNPRAIELLARFFPDAARYTSYDELLAAGAVDAVMLITPPQIHRAQVAAAAAAGVHVFSEKPMAPTVGDCDAMIAACAEAGVTLMVGFMKRFDKSMRHVKSAIDDGSLGTPFRLACRWGGQVPHLEAARDERARSVMREAGQWRSRLGSGGGAFADLGAHTIDLARWWLGDIETVSGEFEIVRGGSELDDAGTGVFRHVSGASSTHLLGWSNQPWEESYQLDATLGTMNVAFGPGASHASVDAFRIRRYTDGGHSITDETLYSDWSIDFELATFGRYTLEVDEFCAAVQEHREPATTGADGRKATEAVNAVYLSAHLGEKVTLPLESSPDLEKIFTDVAARTISRQRHPTVTAVSSGSAAPPVTRTPQTREDHPG